MATIEVQILFSEGCPHTPATVDLIKAVVKEMNLIINLESVLVRSEKQAQELNFLGSPTVRVNGVDIDKSMRKELFTGFT